MTSTVPEEGLVVEGRDDHASVTVRTATADDQAGIRRVLLELHPEGVDGVTLPQVRQEARTFVAMDGDRLVGVAVVTLVDYGREAYGSVDELVVETRSRGAGTGRSLLEQGRRWLEAAGAKVVFVSAVDDRTTRFYLTAGFARCTGPWLYWVPDNPT
jgi:N-acetylglutamate synthase-like GNAT family acetyltransferase